VAISFVSFLLIFFFFEGGFSHLLFSVTRPFPFLTFLAEEESGVRDDQFVVVLSEVRPRVP
jgi:hypothetical protein